MKKCTVTILLIIGLIFFYTEIYASSSFGLSLEKKILLARGERNKEKETKEIKEDKEPEEEKEAKEDKEIELEEKRGSASRKHGFDGKSSRSEGLDGRDKRN